MENRIKSITFDTNCIIQKDKIRSVKKIMELKDANIIEIYKTDAMDTELGQQNMPKSATLIEDLGVGIVDNSRINHSIDGGNDDKIIHKEILQIMFPETKGEFPNNSKIKDVMHLTTHILNKRDYFVTIDKDFLSKKEILKSKYGVNILHPDECLKELEEFLVESR